MSAVASMLLSRMIAATLYLLQNRRAIESTAPGRVLEEYLASGREDRNPIHQPEEDATQSYGDFLKGTCSHSDSTGLSEKANFDRDVVREAAEKEGQVSRDMIST